MMATALLLCALTLQSMTLATAFVPQKDADGRLIVSICTGGKIVQMVLGPDGFEEIEDGETGAADCPVVAAQHMTEAGAPDIAFWTALGAGVVIDTPGDLLRAAPAASIPHPRGPPELT
ncbi:hypothetical protein [Roseovarius aquimarinus]|uniref:Uncharacterized protein n=1 Tax=Roseovarius aquimarinus TaxID=1229156 RepID=A0ABW7IAT5_9RHOB